MLAEKDWSPEPEWRLWPPDDENPVKKQNICVFDGVLNSIKYIMFSWTCLSRERRMAFVSKIAKRGLSTSPAVNAVIKEVNTL